MYLGESFEDRYETPVFALGRLGLDDVVVEVIGPIAWSYGEQFRARGMHEDRAQLSDF
jgi:hypothetical protein